MAPAVSSPLEKRWTGEGRSITALFSLNQDEDPSMQASKTIPSSSGPCHLAHFTVHAHCFTLTSLALTWCLTTSSPLYLNAFLTQAPTAPAEHQEQYPHQDLHPQSILHMVSPSRSPDRLCPPLSLLHQGSQRYTTAVARPWIAATFQSEAVRGTQAIPRASEGWGD